MNELFKMTLGKLMAKNIPFEFYHTADTYWVVYPNKGNRIWEIDARQDDNILSVFVNSDYGTWIKDANMLINTNERTISNNEMLDQEIEIINQVTNSYNKKFDKE